MILCHDLSYNSSLVAFQQETQSTQKYYFFCCSLDIEHRQNDNCVDLCLLLEANFIFIRYDIEWFLSQQNISTMGKIYSTLTRPIRTFNIANRAERIISQEKPVPAPQYPSMKKQKKLSHEGNSDLSQLILLIKKLE